MIWRSLQDVIWPVQPRETILVGDPHEIELALAVLESAGDPRIRVIGYAGSGRANVSADWFGPLDDKNVRAAVREADEVIHASSESSPLQSRLELLRIRGPRGYLLLASPADALLISSARTAQEMKTSCVASLSRPTGASRCNHVAVSS